MFKADIQACKGLRKLTCCLFSVHTCHYGDHCGHLEHRQGVMRLWRADLISYEQAEYMSYIIEFYLRTFPQETHTNGCPRNLILLQQEIIL